MNSVVLIGRLTRDPEVRYTESQLAVARFSIAINRVPGRDGQDRGADFPNIVVFGKQAENCERFLTKGRQVAIQGHIQTGSYEKDGRKVYTTDVVADRVEFLEWGDREQKSDGTPSGFTEINEEDIPF
ncbi:single-stranded DNA-binding protein [Gallibacter intestinalis]|uniref:Single-stranded DNA-binding protein n=1 Tax=Gallibacter intestinalis TaxID=2779356 RepID=A0ABR9QXS3_9FIRM|nr:single-stranded DNA-binding protein [Gallibacter intestinalis]MBE5035688.1 single-stranded DNA-binding protein [Gallibacter intestinalis]